MSQRLRGTRTPVYVELTPGLKYGFQRGNSATEVGAAMGHIALSSAATGVFFGANSPKPARFTRRIGGNNARSITSFASDAAAADLRNNKAQFSLAHPGLKTQGAESIFKTAFNVDMGQYDHAWKVDKVTAGSLAGALGSAGARAGVTARSVFGARPLPPRGTITIGGLKYSTFIAPGSIDTAAQAGWAVRGRQLAGA